MIDTHSDLSLTLKKVFIKIVSVSFLIYAFTLKFINSARDFFTTPGWSITSKSQSFFFFLSAPLVWLTDDNKDSSH